MQRYRYKHGDRPLEGYTIQRAAGSGGFGEVYYALSDSGREVAIKAVQNYEQIELRGISQCMNLKSPHLVTIFDVKHNQHNEPFVIMEYVSGPSLRDLLTESPGGLGAQKSAFFLREIAKGISFLHDCGIVHRDLKPSNIFYENGYVKVGDYGLTKAISASRHSGHTITVGTVHYMAPEIGAGNYNYGIDIYALGILLYEMLTGEVPFVGGSPAEILMKHMTATPELDQIDEPFAHVIKKALAKDPKDRYKSVQEMIEDLFGSENIRNSVSHFSPDELSVVAGRVAAKVDFGKKFDSDKPTMDVTPAPAEVAGKQFAGTAERFAKQADDFGRSVADKVDAKVDKIFGAKKTRIPGITDPIQPKQRQVLVFISMLIVALGAGLLQAGHNGAGIFQTALLVIIMTSVNAKVMLSSRRRWLAVHEHHSQRFSRLATCALASCLAALIGAFLPQFFGFQGQASEIGPFGWGFRFPMKVLGFGPGYFGRFTPTWLSLFVPMLLVDWQRISNPDRAERLSLGSALWIGILGAIAATIFNSNAIVIAAVLAGTSLVVQTASSFSEPGQDDRGPRGQAQKKQTQFHQSLTGGIVPAGMRSLWLAASLSALALGLFLVIYSGSELNGDDYAVGVAFGVDSLILSIFFFIGSCRSRFNGWYRYLVKPALLLVCILIAVASAICMGNMNLQNDEYAVSLFFIIFPVMAFLVIAIIPAGTIVGHPSKPACPPAPPVSRPPQLAPGVSSFKRLWALLLCLLPIPGLQRFYVGKIGTGILWFLTGGIFGIGQLIDLIMIIVGQFKDRYGLPLVVWQDKEELKADKFKARPAVPVQAAAPKAVVTDKPAQKVQPPPVPTAPKTASVMKTTTVIYQPFHPLAFLSSGLGFICTVLAVIVGIITALQLPHFIAAGWLNTGLAADAEQFFGYPQWPELVVRLGTIITVVLLLLAAVFMILGRRHLGIMHLFRSVLGLGGLFISIFLVIDCIRGYRFGNIQQALNAGQIGPAFEKLLDSCMDGEVIFAAFVFLFSIFILAWPPSRKQTVITPVPNQGVS
jgi:hypothetical protein